MEFIDLTAQPASYLVGSKAARLGWLMSQGWPVPPGRVAPFEATDQILGGTAAAALESLRAGLTTWIDPRRRYVVRSSANVEDQGRCSFAGQFDSITGVSGIDEVLDAVRLVAGSGRSEHVRAYASAAGVDDAGVRVAVIVQEMVSPVVSGVAFSRDPVTGHDRVVVEAITGAGEQLLARGVTPQRWIRDSDSALQEPESPVLPVGVALQIMDIVGRIAQASEESADVEWVWDGEGLHVVQWRPISGPVASPRVWSSRMARDMLPGLIPPLVWSVNVPVLSRVWADLVSDALGDVGLDPDELVRAFGYRAYFNTGAFGSVFASLGMPTDALERMRDGTSRSAIRPPVSMLVRRTPRLARFALALATWDRRAATEQQGLDLARRTEELVDVRTLSDAALVARVQRLRNLLARAGRLNVVTPLLADAWAASIRRAALARGIDPGTVDPGQELPEVRGLDPAHALAQIDPGDDVSWEEFMVRFGHLSDSPNDCSLPTWVEQPEVVRRIAEPAQGQLHRASGSASTNPARDVLGASGGAWTRSMMRRRWDRAARYRLARERVGYSYARVYALFRPTFLEAGRRLVDRGVLSEAADVFLLDLDEVDRALSAALPDAADLVSNRRAEMAEAADLHWPETIFGDDPMPIRGRSRARVLTGVPTAGGRHTGPARVVTSLATAGEIGPSDVLVLAAADVTWTPLLLRAGAVVTETGGMLSHASIVAREFGLPCVACVEGATAIPEGALVSVDGAAGEVIVLDATVPPAAPSGAAQADGAVPR